MTTPLTTFLDVNELLDRSHPRPRRHVAAYVLGVALLLVLIGSYMASNSPGVQRMVEVLGALLMLAVMGGLTLFGMNFVRAHRAEAMRLEAIEELVQLRRWSEAAHELQGLLSQPTRTPVARVQGLLYLTSVLGRYHRFHEAIIVQDELLETIDLDPGTAHSLKLGRAMAMLREDQLVDADRAISELRRESAGESGGLALIEIYRDIRTNHADEAVKLFRTKLPQMRRQLGYRLGDAWALVAKAQEVLGDDDQARGAWDNALLLAPVEELVRRYPEVQTLAARYNGFVALPGVPVELSAQALNTPVQPIEKQNVDGSAASEEGAA